MQTHLTTPPGQPSKPGRVLAVIALGGRVGSLARYGLSTTWPDAGDVVPWTTLAINVPVSLLLGMLVVAVTEIWRPHRLIRPLLGTGVLGGFTTFSTFAVQARGLSIGPGAGTWRSAWSVACLPPRWGWR